MDDRTSSASLPTRRNPRAVASLLVGLLSLLVVPAGVYASRESDAVTLLNSAGTLALAVLFGTYAVLLSRRARALVAITLGRAGGARTAQVGRALGLLGILIGITGGLALGFYGLLTLFAD